MNRRDFLKAIPVAASIVVVPGCLPKVVASTKSEQDSAFNMDAEIMSDAAEAFALSEEQNFIPLFSENYIIQEAMMVQGVTRVHVQEMGMGRVLVTICVDGDIASKVEQVRERLERIRPACCDLLLRGSSEGGYVVTKNFDDWTIPASFRGRRFTVRR